MKKWTFLVASAMLVGATPVFTGCIDNDEPEGISVLRGAKAELLKAKASVEAAKVAQVQADAALTLAQAEVQKAEAARIQAIADYESAKALEMQFKAELQNIKNEEQRADLENKIKIYEEQRAAAEREAQKAAAELETSLMYWKGELAKQQAAYEIALKDLALAKTTLTQKQQDYLEPWSDALDAAKTKVDWTGYILERKAKTLASAVRELEEQKAKEYLFVEKQWDVDEAKADWDAKALAEAEAKAYAEKDFEATKWDEERIALEEKYRAADLKLSLAQTKKTDLQTQDETKKLAKDVKELKEAYEEMAGVWNEDGQLVFDATKYFEFDPIKDIVLNDENLPVIIPNSSEKTTIWKVEGDDLKYLYSNYLNNLQDITIIPAIDKLDKYIKEATSWTLDANDVAWKKEQIVVLEDQLEKQKEIVKGDKEAWEKAAALYTNGKIYGDVSSIDGYEYVKEAVDAFNETIEPLNKAMKALNDFVAETVKPANTAYEEALAKANETKQKDIKAAEKERDNKLNEIADNVSKLYNTSEVKYSAWQKLYAEYQLITDPTEAQAKAVEDARIAANTAYTAYNKARQEKSGLESNAWDIYNKKERLADNTYDLAYNTAYETYYKDSYESPKYKELNKNYSDARSARTSALYSAKSAYRSFLSWNGLDLYDTSLFEKELMNAYEKDEDLHITAYLTVDPATIAKVNKSTLETYVKNLAETLFGTKNNDRLLDLTKEQIDAQIEAAYMSINSNAEFVPYTYVNSQYGYYYGSTGKLLGIETQLKAAKAAIEGTAVEDLLAELNADRQKVVDEVAIHTGIVDEAQDKYTKAEEAYDALFVEVDTEIRAARAEKRALEPVISQLKQAIMKFLGYEGAKAETMEVFKAEIKAAYDVARTATKDAEVDYLQKVENLNNLTASQQKAVDLAKEDWEAAKAKLETAQAELEAANDALQAEIERISTVE
ncbi:hypothetical protein [Bacteroides bouchesdurhonensis]